ncbi:MAG: hypothetical protein P8J32_00765 [bacterium]|jgi:dipeptidyl aminopeptidase/acylaminoacyl peptidase|nr:hypothetical protein [bacterium]
MNERTKKILLVVGFIASVFIFAFILYRLFFVSQAPEATVGSGQADTTFGDLPESVLEEIREIQDAIQTEDGLVEADDVASGGLTQTTTLTTTAVYNTNTSADGDGVSYYNESDGRFYTIDENGNVVALSSQQFPDAENVEWNKDADTVVVEFPDGSNIVYNFETETQVTLPSHWEDFDFSPVQDEIIAKSMALDPSARALVITDDDGSSTETIAALGENADKVDVNWSPNNQVVAFASTSDSISSGIDRNMIFPVGKNDENYKGLVVEGLDFLSNWSPDGKTLLYSVVGNYSDNKPLLWTVSATASTMGENRSSIGLNTWADKCTWSSSTEIYCAVPLEMPDNAGLGRELYATLPDAIYKVNLSTGRSSIIGIPADATSVNNISVSSDESELFFTNDFGQLEVMQLK